MDRPILDKLITEVRHFGDRDFLKAAMAVCALAAIADGNVLPSDHEQIRKALETDSALKELDTEKALDTLFEYIYALRTYGQEAEDILRNKIGRMAGHDKRSRTLMRVAYLVIVADGEIQDGERVEFRRLCQLLGLNPEKVWGDLEV